MWSWVEAKPGVFTFDDYDRIIAGARRHGLNVVLSIIAEVHPYWIHRLIPDCELVTNQGHRVVSENRNECHNGLTPGGCFDHPEVWKRMAAFIGATARHYRGCASVVGWDAWNELRWNVQADAPVCYCPYTLQRYRKWLKQRFGNLQNLNANWIRRYDSWDDVMPGKTTHRPYTSSMSFAHFLTCRANEHARDRYRIIRTIDPARPVTAHGPAPSPMMVGGYGPDQALNRGNDWFMGDELDGIGCSNFPTWGNQPATDYMISMEMVRSAARMKRFWVSELQGGRSSTGFQVHNPVRAIDQQRWIWNSIASGAETVLLWCWRDEVFGSESNGFGFIGNDGFAEERIEAMRHTQSVLRTHTRLLENYAPSASEVGVMFSPQTYYLHWAQDNSAMQPLISMRGFCKALVRKSVPFTIVEEEHLEALAGIKFLILPRVTALEDNTITALQHFVRNGGVLFCEAETGAWDSRGMFRYPEDRFPAALAGIREAGRRPVPADPVFTAHLARRTYHLRAAHLLSPWMASRAQTLAAFASPEGAMLARVKVGKGALLLCGTYLGDEYDKACYTDFEDLVFELIRESGADTGAVMVEAQAKPDFNSHVYVRYGRSRGKPVVFVFFPKGCPSARLSFALDFWRDSRVTDLFSGKDLHLVTSGRTRRLDLKPGALRVAALTEHDAAYASRSRLRR